MSIKNQFKPFVPMTPQDRKRAQLKNGYRMPGVDYSDVEDVPYDPPKMDEKPGAKSVEKKVEKGGENLVAISIRLDADLIERFKKDGPHWQVRMREALREYVNGPKRGAE